MKDRAFKTGITGVLLVAYLFLSGCACGYHGNHCDSSVAESHALIALNEGMSK